MTLQDGDVSSVRVCGLDAVVQMVGGGTLEIKGVALPREHVDALLFIERYGDPLPHALATSRCAAEGWHAQDELHQCFYWRSVEI